MRELIDIDMVTDDSYELYKNRNNSGEYSVSTKAYIIRMLLKIREKVIREFGVEDGDRVHPDLKYRSIRHKPGRDLSFHPEGRFYRVAGSFI